MGRPNTSRETKFSGSNRDRNIFIFPVQLTTSRIGSLTRLIHTLLYVMTIHTYIECCTCTCTADICRGAISKQNQWRGQRGTKSTRERKPSAIK